VAKGLTRLVGRKNSMATPTEAWEKAASGSGQEVGIVGEAVVGKSRLLLEMRRTLPQDEHIYLEGRCLHFGGSIVYLPILDILRSYFEVNEGDREFLIKKNIKMKIMHWNEIVRS
jgi:predicted ATPase